MVELLTIRSLVFLQKLYIYFFFTQQKFKKRKKKKKKKKWNYQISAQIVSKIEK